jgi:hypothetical protein
MFIDSLVVTILLAVAHNVVAQTPDWPELYDPELILNLHIKLKSDDFNTINNDSTFEIEVPALFWEEADGEASAQLVSIRRKSADPLGPKVSYKIDINEYEGELDDTLGLAKKSWHSVKKLSLENGDDKDVVTEHLGWMMNMLAENVIYPVGHKPGMANYAGLTAHLVSGGVDRFDFSGSVDEPKYLGLYVNVEQPDKQFLKNRGKWVSDQTYLYKAGDLNGAERKEVGCEDDVTKIDSPTYHTLDCKPFSNGKQAKDCTYEELHNSIDMDVMLSQGAIETFISSPDDLFSKGKNYYFVDYSDETCTAEASTMKRAYYQWDLDSVFHKVTQDIYTMTAGGGGGGKGGPKRHLQKGSGGGGGKTSTQQTPYQKIIFGYEPFLTIFNAKLGLLLDTAEDSIINKAIDYLDLMKPALVPYLEADVNSGPALGSLDNLPAWLAKRQEIVAEQICSDYASSATSCATTGSRSV